MLRERGGVDPVHDNNEDDEGKVLFCSFISEGGFPFP